MCILGRGGLGNFEFAMFSAAKLDTFKSALHSPKNKSATNVWTVNPYTLESDVVGKSCSILPDNKPISVTQRVSLVSEE